MSSEFILSSCTQYGPDRIVHFLNSYSKYCQDAKLIVFGGDLPDESISAIERVGGTFIDITSHYNRVSPFNLRIVQRFRRCYSLNWFFRIYKLAAMIDQAKFGSSNGLQYRVTGVLALRYLEYYQFVNTIDDQTGVFITDIRDVIFQSNPFASKIVGLELYQEENNLLGTCKFNYPWLERAVGPNKARKLRANPVLCAGTTAGDANAMRGYLGVMSSHVSNNTLPVGLIDQAYHNYSYYSGALSELNTTVFENRYGRVQTLGTQGSYTLSAGYIRNNDQSVVPVVHQWDRFETLNLWADNHCNV